MVLFQNPDNLFLCKSALLHRPSPFPENRLTFNRGQFRGAGHLLSEKPGPQADAKLT
jgi:hypothetical protein